MKFNFKIQDYQTKAVQSVVDCFKGQPFIDRTSYRRDIGKVNEFSCSQMHAPSYFDHNYEEDFDLGFKNEPLHIEFKDILSNIKSIQQKNNLTISEKLEPGIGNCSIDVEMETGTGKTYVYIKTMYELYRNYGWSKFIVVVPSIAIREGVKKSFEVTEDHFMRLYGKKIRYFVYDSSNLNQIDYFSSNAGINVMIINMQAFNSSFKEGKKNKVARKIYDEVDAFNSRRPIDVIKANNPILILDEPQKMGGKNTQEGLNDFNPLFSLNYSATHVKKHNLVYALDSLDAYNERLVKKIQVKGISEKNLTGTDGYFYLENIILDQNKPPRARLEFEVMHKNGIKRERRIVSTDDDIYELSKNMEQYKGFTVSEINPYNDSITFTNGESIKTGEISGDVNEAYFRRIQIREAIRSHFEKERTLFYKGIKTLSLFFIDEVKKYRVYDEDGNAELGEYAKIFEEEYNSILDGILKGGESEYTKYLKGIDVSKTHNGYFAIDKKGRYETKYDNKDRADDISAYDLILKNKERLLSFEEPTRFIFSHSALREGWDNPNIFQICTLKKSDNENLKRQEVGRGLRICVNKDGTRMDKEVVGSAVHDINKLTVIASESYENFVDGLQKETNDNLRERPEQANADYFEGKIVSSSDGDEKITKEKANIIYQYLVKNDYVSDDGKDYITDKYHEDLNNNSFAALPDSLKDIGQDVHKLIQNIFDKNAVVNMIENGHSTTIENKLNDNFYKKEFKTLWNYINHKYVYKVDFDTDELIHKSVDSINRNLFVSVFQYTIKTSEQKDVITAEDARAKYSFKNATSETHTIKGAISPSIKYDLIGKIKEKTTLTRKTVATILSKISKEKFDMYKDNPEEFITKVSNLIVDEKATMIIEHISYDEIDEKYDSSIFTAENGVDFKRALKVKKHIKDYVITDGLAENSVEKRFAKDLEGATEVCVYAKLPRGFQIPTPVGNYNPDWAIAFKEGSVKHIFFIAETKGTMKSLELRPVEKAKIVCAKRLFNEISTENVVYHDVDSYETLIKNVMPHISKRV